MFGHVDYESHLLGRFLSCSPETPMSGEIFAPLWDSETRRQGNEEGFALWSLSVSVDSGKKIMYLQL